MKLEWWMIWLLAELLVVLTVLLGLVWWQGIRALRGAGSVVTAAPIEDSNPLSESIVSRAPEVPTLESHELDAIDSGEAPELRAQLRRSVEEMSRVTDASRELSTKVSATLMSLLEVQANVQNLVTRVNAISALPADAATAIAELLEQLRSSDPMLIERRSSSTRSTRACRAWRQSCNVTTGTAVSSGSAFDRASKGSTD
ncbi:MAG: hypothetical protein HC923_08195 [Myxococcales bacterium]|nr:hypothetical protein [Myxococcales bacterium]